MQYKLNETLPRDHSVLVYEMCVCVHAYAWSCAHVTALVELTLCQQIVTLKSAIISNS